MTETGSLGENEVMLEAKAGVDIGNETFGDPVLGYMLDIMELTGVSLDITLVCGGVFVAGSPVSAELHHAKVRAYLHARLSQGAVRYTGVEQTAESMKRAAKSVEAMEALIGTGLQKFGEMSSKYLERAYDLDDRESDHPESSRLKARPGDRRFINLERVTISRGRDDAVDIPFWRGRLNEVTGWSLGRWRIGAYEGPDR